MQNFKKFLQRIQDYADAPFFGPKWYIYPKQIFILENYYYHFINLLAPFVVQNFKTEIRQKKSYAKEKTSNQKLSQWFKTYKKNFIY